MKYQLTLYKYKPLSTIDALQNLEDSLTQKIWMPPLSSLNDPYEGVFRLTIPTYETVIKNPALIKIVQDVLKENGEPEQSEDDIKRLLPQFLEMLKGNRQMITNQFSQFGAFSFTDDYSNIPMWAYYADEHKGYCLIFEVDLSTAFTQLNLAPSQQDEYFELIKSGEEPLSYVSNDGEIRFAFSKIRYSKVIPEMKFERALELRNEDEATKLRFALKYAYGVKSDQWQTENEYRLIANANSIHHGDRKAMCMKLYAPFIKIKGLIMGKDLKPKSILTDLCKRYQMDLYVASRSEIEYKIDIKKILDCGNQVDETASSVAQL